MMVGGVVEAERAIKAASFVAYPKRTREAERGAREYGKSEDKRARRQDSLRHQAARPSSTTKLTGTSVGVVEGRKEKDGRQDQTGREEKTKQIEVVDGSSWRGMGGGMGSEGRVAST